MKQTAEQLAQKYAEGKSSSSVFQEAHIRDFLEGFGAKEKQIKDKINALKSQLKQEQIEKLGRVTNQYRIEQIQLQIKTLEELCG